MATGRRFASYEKVVVPTKIRVWHGVRIPLNAEATSVLDAMNKVPSRATVSMVVDDTENGGYGEIVFIEEQEEELKNE